MSLIPLGLVSTLVLGQVSEPSGARVQAIQAVERGLFVQTDLGAGVNVAGFGSADGSVGASLSAHLGYDILPVFNIAVGGFAMTVPNGSSFDADAPASGSDDFLVGATARAQLAVLTSERDFLWVRGEGGIAFALPGDEPDAVFGGAVTYEHFTKLRHFSLGLTAGALVFSQDPLAVSILVTPTLKFTF
ncbi:MAG: hypothetical protein ACFB9M_20825 [Myxococcota bacterium]